METCAGNREKKDIDIMITIHRNGV